MPKPFDATLKQLIRHHPTDWLGLIGVTPNSEPEWVDAELSTVSASADAVITAGDVAYHFEFESGPDKMLAERVLMYNTVAHFRTELPVKSTAVLLRSNALTARLSEVVAYAQLTFRFDIVKIWQQPASRFLKSSLGLLPLAVLGQPPKGKTREQVLPEQVDRIIERAVSEAGDRRSELVTASFILAGMHASLQFLQMLFSKGLTMIESSAFALMELLAVQRKMRETVLKLATARFGPPTTEQLAKLNSIDDLDDLDRLALRLLKVKSWETLLKRK